jgi:hypothetical protein
MEYFLRCLSRVLMEEGHMLRVEGCRGVANICAILMALCPEDTTLLVDKQVVAAGERQSVIQDIFSKTQIQSTLEMILYSSGGPTNFRFAFNSGIDLFQSTQTAVKWEGWLSTAIHCAMANLTTSTTASVTSACVDLIAAILFNVSGKI